MFVTFPANDTKNLKSFLHYPPSHCSQFLNQENHQSQNEWSLEQLLKVKGEANIFCAAELSPVLIAQSQNFQ